MSACEKCWSDADILAALRGMSKSEVYLILLEERRDNPYSPEQQAGEQAMTCSKCGRRAVHQWTGECMACGDCPELGQSHERSSV